MNGEVYPELLEGARGRRISRRSRARNHRIRRVEFPRSGGMMHEVYTRRAALKTLAGALAVAAHRYPLAVERNHAMSSRPIPRTGERLPVVGVGTWQTFDVGPNAPERTELKDVLRLLAQYGGSVIDSSPMY